MGNRNNTKWLGKKVYNNKNINRKEQSNNDNTNKLTKKHKKKHWQIVKTDIQ